MIQHRVWREVRAWALMASIKCDLEQLQKDLDNAGCHSKMIWHDGEMLGFEE